MLRTDLIDLINSGSAWAFVGSGTSIGSGLPGWEELLEGVIASTDDGTQEWLAQNNRYKGLFEAGDYASCLGLVESAIGREALEAQVRARLSTPAKAGSLLAAVTDWPFAGYITTNYDNLIATRLNQGSDPGWAPIGNTDDELRKLAGVDRGLVWHIHGALELPAEASRLVLTATDYDDAYLEESKTSQVLRNVLSLRRLVVVGFGMRDPELMRLLRRVGRMSNPARPIYAFLPESGELSSDDQRRELLERYNVDAIAYRVSNDDSHRELNELVDTYGAFILRRSLRFGRQARECPSYHPETTGLLVYNSLVLQRGIGSSDDAVSTLMRARVLALLIDKAELSEAAVIADLAARVTLLRSDGRVTDDAVTLLASVLSELESDGYIAPGEGRSTWRLLPAGADLVANQAAAADLMAKQFGASLRGRAENLGHDANVAARVAAAAESFLTTCLQRRALGVALAVNQEKPAHQSFHVVALLQSLPEWLETMPDSNEAGAVIAVVRGVLSRPTDAERLHIGLVLQAVFGASLLGFDPDALSARLREFQGTLFLIDSSTLIPFLARSSSGYEFAHALLSRLSSAGSEVATTEMLAEEVAEHARWAMRKFDDQGRVGVVALEAATGRAGERPNEFLDGFIVESSTGSIPPMFGEYLRSILGELKDREKYRGVHVSDTLESADIRVIRFDGWDGFEPTLWNERDEIEARIAAIRQERDTYRHERQVRAEAEALLLVREIRAGRFRTEGTTVLHSAFFVSQTRILDQIEGQGRAITLRPEAALQWGATVAPLSTSEHRSLTNALLWELHERGLSFVDPPTLEVVFGPLASAARGQLAEEIERHRAAIANRYGETSIHAFGEVTLLDVPVVLRSLYAQEAEDLRREVEEIRRAEKRRAEQAALDAKERKELERFRAQQKDRTARGRSKQRAAQSQPRRRRK